MTDEDQKAQIKQFFSVCTNDQERRQTFLIFFHDTSYKRHIIVQVMKELGINDDFSLKKIGY